MAPKKKKAELDDVIEESPKKKKSASVEGMTDEEERDVALAALFKAANKNYGPGTLIYADDDKFKVTHRISTGVLPLDYALGGGIPVGRISLFYGHKSTSKTTNILRMIGNAQKMCSNCWTYIVPNGTDGDLTCSCGKKRKTVVAWLDVEGVWDHDWSCKFLTVDDTLMLSHPASAEETIDVAHAALQAQVDIIVIDSIAFMTSLIEQEKSSQEVTVALQARAIGGMIRKFVSITNSLGKTKGRRPTIILTNQIRLKVGVMFGSPETTSGGLAAGFATSVEIKTSAGKYEMDDVSGKPMAMENKAKIEKNKTASPKIEAEWKVALMKNEVKNVGQPMDEEWAFDMGEKAGIISVAPQRIEWDGKTYRGRSQLEKFWMDNPIEYIKYKNQLMPILLAI